MKGVHIRPLDSFALFSCRFLSSFPFVFGHCRFLTVSIYSYHLQRPSPSSVVAWIFDSTLLYSLVMTTPFWIPYMAFSHLTPWHSPPESSRPLFKSRGLVPKTGFLLCSNIALTPTGITGMLV